MVVRMLNINVVNLAFLSGSQTFVVTATEVGDLTALDATHHKAIIDLHPDIQAGDRCLGCCHELTSTMDTKLTKEVLVNGFMKYPNTVSFYCRLSFSPR